MGYLPVSVSLTGRSCVVIGGGAVAERKVEALLRLGARVTLISPVLTAQLRDAVSGGSVRHVGRCYRTGDLSAGSLIFIATDRDVVNSQVVEDARGMGLWVNAADDPSNCDFILPSVLRRGALAVAVSTEGWSPAFARFVREELEQVVTQEYSVMLEIAAAARRELREKGRAASMDTWRNALDGQFRKLVAAGKRGAAKRRLLAALGGV